MLGRRGVRRRVRGESGKGGESLELHHTLSSWVASGDETTRLVDRTVFSSGKRLKREGSKVKVPPHLLVTSEYWTASQNLIRSHIHVNVDTLRTGVEASIWVRMLCDKCNHISHTHTQGSIHDPPHSSPLHPSTLASGRT